MQEWQCVLRSSRRVHLYPSIVASGSQQSAVLHLIFSIQTEILYLWCQLEKRKWTNEAAGDPDVWLTVIFPWLPQQAGQVFIHQLLCPIKLQVQIDLLVTWCWPNGEVMERVAGFQKPAASPTPAHCLCHNLQLNLEKETGEIQVILLYYMLLKVPEWEYGSV